MLSAVMLSAVMLSAVMLSAVMLSIVSYAMLSAVMLSIISYAMLSAVMLSFVALCRVPLCYAECHCAAHKLLMITNLVSVPYPKSESDISGDLLAVKAPTS